MRIIMMGTGPFAVPTFEALLQSDHEVPVLVTRPTRPSRSRGGPPENPMRSVAEARSINVLDPADVNSSDSIEQLTLLKANLMVVCDYGQILSADALAATTHGGINLHGSLLPKYRGAAPINWALYHGDTETGVSVIHMTPRLDAGPVVTTRSTPIDPDEEATQVETRLSLLGVPAVLESIELLAPWQPGSTVGTVQDAQLSTKAPRLKKSDGLVRWTRTAQQLHDQVRAFKPWPGTYTHWVRPSRDPIRLILQQVSLVDDDATQAEPGTIVRCDRQQLWVATGEGVLSLDRVQPAGKREMHVSEFLRGHRLAEGARLGMNDRG